MYDWKIALLDLWIQRRCVDWALGCHDLPNALRLTKATLDKVKKRRHAIWLLRFAFNNSWKVPGGFPFTRLGYTYDWNPEDEDHFGVSEYVVRKNTHVLVLGNVSTEEYCSSD